MIEQFKSVGSNWSVYGTRFKGSRTVTLVWKFNGKIDPDVNMETDRMPVGQSLKSWMEVTFYGVVYPVTGLPGQR